MAQDFGPGVSRTLSARDRQFQVVVWQPGKPPLDSELNLMMQADWERQAEEVRSTMHSGWLIDPFNSDLDFVTNPDWANFFEVGTGAAFPTLWANVNGWTVPVTGTATETASNRISLFPPPSSDARIDFVFLEVWLAQLAPNPSEVNKPSASTIYKYGNTEYGGINISDDLEDPSIGFETTERVQLQYRLRVVGRGTGLGDSIDLSTFPDGLDDPNVLAQGTATAPVAGYAWQNMRDELGDPGLWRSGDGDADNDLGTVDGYSYAIPLCAIFRRNTGGFVARTASGNARQNGAMNRNPISAAIVDPSEASRAFTPVTLTSAIDESTGVVQVDGLSGSGLDNTDIDWTSTFLVIDQEVIQISGVDTSVSPGTITITARGRNGTQASPHDAGTQVQFYIFRADGLTADMVAPGDILDLRKGVTRGEWDYQALLAHNLGKLFNNTLRSSYKQAFNSDTEGPTVVGVDTLWADGAFAVPAQTGELDGPDGIRYMFSDAATVQNTSLILNPATTSPGTPTAVTDYTSGAGDWDPAAGFEPDGFQPDGGGWNDQTVIRLYIGGTTSGANGGARLTVRTDSDNRFVRFVSPREYWLSRDEISQQATGAAGRQAPFMLRWFAEAWCEPAAGTELEAEHPGPMYPLPEHNFERPFIVLGGVVNSLLRDSVTTSTASSATSGLDELVFPGLDFSAAGDWYSASGIVESLSTEGINYLLLYGERNLYDMLTNGGRDLTGASSELYVVLTGDSGNAANCGVFRVIGAGNAGFTTELASDVDRLVVQRVGEGAASLVTGQTVTAEVRSQYTHTQDNDNSAEAAAVIVLTDLQSVQGAESSPWFGLPTASLEESQAVLDTAVLYGPSRGGTARVANRIDRLAWVNGVSEFVREAPTDLDTTFAAEAGIADGEIYFPVDNHVQMWARLTSLGLPAPYAPAYGGNYLGEQRREAEAFFDPGSKTLVLQPFQRGDFTLYRVQITAGDLFPSQYTLGDSAGIDVDPVPRIFTASRDYAYAYPWEYMPRFGRQDIPFHKTTGTGGPVYYGINHMFGDSETDADEVFRVVGGPDNNATVESMFFVTGSSTGYVYGQYGAVGTASAFQARTYEDVNVQSSDVPRGLKGIQLPPFMGVVRLYGVYDKREFSGLGAWDTDRVTPVTTGRPQNLLRTDVDKQTLYIVPGGAADVTGSTDDHTYVIPADLIDVRRSGSYTAGETFDDLEFVVECVIFGFARGFINKNNFVLARQNLPDGNDGTTVAALASSVSCIAPLPVKYNDQMYVAYHRTPYQGDPYMTRDGATKTTSDYANRLGQVPQSGAFELATPLPQFDSSNDYAQVPETLNARSLEVLASVDFFTTLGTGKVGGKVYPGTPLDVAHVTNQGAAPGRIPSASDDPIWQSEVRSFTQGALQADPKAIGQITVLENTTVSAGEFVRFTRNGESFSLESNNDFTGATVVAAAQFLSRAINNSVLIRNKTGVVSVWGGGNTVTLFSLLRGAEGNETLVGILPAVGSRSAVGFQMDPGPADRQYGMVPNQVALYGGKDSPTIGATSTSAPTPVQMAGLTERLPLGILLQDADFIGEDPLRDGVSMLQVVASGGSVGGDREIPIGQQGEYGRIQGAGQLGMADGSILQYQAATGSPPTGGATSFRLFRGGGSAWVLDPGPCGGPVDWSAGSYLEGAEPVLKGAVLAGRAFLVRNWPEDAYSDDQVKSYGDEIQMVVLTQGIVGEGAGCGTGYSLTGKISPTGYGEGFSASDRYRLEGKPLINGHSRSPVDPDCELAPYPGNDEGDDPCPC